MILHRLRVCLSDAPAAAWKKQELEECIRDFCDMNGVDFRDACQLLRAAVTASLESPPLFAVLEILGREESLGRIDDVLPAETLRELSTIGEWAVPGFRPVRKERGD